MLIKRFFNARRMYAEHTSFSVSGSESVTVRRSAVGRAPNTKTPSTSCMAWRNLKTQPLFLRLTLPSTLPQRNLKTNDGFSENASDVFVHTTSEEFENEGFSLKMRYQMFFINTTRGVKTQQSTVNLDLCLRKLTWSSFSKISVFKMSSPTLKASFSLRISVDGRPNCTNNPPFSHYSSFKVWTRPNPSR